MQHPAGASCVFLLLAIYSSYAAAIGVVKAGGSFNLDGHPVVGNATLFAGNVVETRAASSELNLTNGVRMVLATASKGVVFTDRLLLDQGMGQLTGSADYHIEARGLRFQPEASDSVGRVAVSVERTVQAAAVRGALRVTAADGTVVALVRPGMALEFEPQAVTGAEAPFEMTGCMERRNGRYVLRDPVTGVVEEVRGRNLEREAGRMVEVTATLLPKEKPVEGALEVIEILRLRRVAGACPVAPAAEAKAPPAEPKAPAAKSAPAPPPQPGAGMSGATKAVIAGVIVGGAGAGAAVYFLQSESEEKGTISR